jgi:hypothetical protein
LGIYKANAATDPLTIGAHITGAINIDCTTQNLEFGRIVASGVAGTVTVDAAGTAVDGGGATYVSGAAAGQCLLQGNISTAYTVDYVVNDLTGPGANMTLTSLESDNLNGDGPFSGLGTFTANLDVNGEDTLSIGGTLNVGAGQVTGSYTGTVVVTVDYV